MYIQKSISPIKKVRYLAEMFENERRRRLFYKISVRIRITIIIRESLLARALNFCRVDQKQLVKTLSTGVALN